MYEKFSDEQMVNLVINKDQNLYRVLVDRYSAKLFRYANYLIHKEHKAADVVQETFIKAFINLRGFNPKHKFSSWLFRIAHNESMNAIKKHQRELPILPDMDFASTEDLEENYSRQEVARLAQTCLQNIPSEYSAPLSLYYLEELSYQEISDILRIPINTVGTRISRAKLLMKHLCQKKL